MVVGWYQTGDGDIHAHIFESKTEVYGIFLGVPAVVSNNAIWFRVLVGPRIYLFLRKQLEIAVTPDTT